LDDLANRNARWHIFRPKFKIWVNFGGSCNRRCWEIFMSIWYILQSFGIFFGYLVYFSRFGVLYQEKSGNLACKQTLVLIARRHYACI
jgi:hypothetical protein